MPLWVLPFRVPQPCDDLVDQLTTWLDGEDDVDASDEADASDIVTEEANVVRGPSHTPAVVPAAAALEADTKIPRPDFSSRECHADIVYFADCRHQLESILSRRFHVDAESESESTDTMNETFLLQTCLPLLQDYAAALGEFCDRGFPVTDAHGDGLTLTWQCSPYHYHTRHYANDFATTTHDDDQQAHPLETHHSLAWERANVVYNIAVVHVLHALTLPLDSRTAWTKAGTCLQHAATVVQYLRHFIVDASLTWHPTVLSDPVLMVWESYLLAEAQRAAYQTFHMQPRPKHFMLAKLAAAAAPLFATVEDMCHGTELSVPLHATAQDYLVEWNDLARAWGMWMTALAEHHQSMVHRDKKEWGLELARLEGALKFGNFCQEFCESSLYLADVALLVRPVLHDIDQRLEWAEAENNETFHEPVLEHDELPEVTPQLSVKTDLENISKLLPSGSKPLFTSVLDPTLRRYADTFRADIGKVVTQTEWLAEEKTHAGRTALAAVQLPHALTAYRHDSGMCGILDATWERVDAVQRDRKIDKLLDDLWKVRSHADSARSTYQQMQDHLQDDLEVDSLFRQKHPNFEGHDVTDIQKPFRQALQNYQSLMVSAHESDDLLIRRCEVIESDPKFRLLKLQKAQLDRLVPVGLSTAETDVSMLSQYLVELSTLFSERDSLRHELKEKAKTYHIGDELASLGPHATHHDYRRVLEDAKASFYGLVADMKLNLEQQTPLLSKILWENEQFTRSREQVQADNDESPLVKVEDALDEIDEVSQHLKEGKAFYDVVIPKLEKLYQQVEDLSMRLSQERSDYEAYANRPRPEPTLPSQRVDRPTGGGPTSGRYNGSTPSGRGGARLDASSPATSMRPTSSHRLDVSSDADADADAILRVDDEKVASLVAMDFDPDQVVAALSKHQNDLEQALNELLSS